MSSGNFVLSKYETNAGNIHPIRVQPETLALNVGAANAEPSGAVDQEVSAQARKGKREIGIGARSVSFRFTGAAPTDYAENQTYTAPILTPEVWDGALRGTTGTYLGSAIVVTGRSPESIR